MSTNLQLSPPWDTYFKMVYNLLSVDPEIKMPKTIRQDEGAKYSFWIESTNATKIIALSRILKNTVTIGNITVNISFRCINNDISKLKSAEKITAADFDDAFAGNPYFFETISEIVPGGAAYFAVFKREIISFYNDDISDYHCNAHYIVADLVKQIINPTSVNVCTEYDEQEH